MLRRATGALYYDDSQVVDISAKKRYASRDQVMSITITPVHV